MAPAWNGFSIILDETGGHPNNHRPSLWILTLSVPANFFLAHISTADLRFVWNLVEFLESANIRCLHWGEQFIDHICVRLSRKRGQVFRDGNTYIYAKPFDFSKDIKICKGLPKKIEQGYKKCISGRSQSNLQLSAPKDDFSKYSFRVSLSCFFNIDLSSHRRPNKAKYAVPRAPLTSPSGPY